MQKMEARNLALLSFKHGIGVLKMKKLLVKYDFKGNVKRKLTEVEKKWYSSIGLPFSYGCREYL
jgi:hypothetical protein